jgi:release factor glutamine methyltransferase
VTTAQQLLVDAKALGLVLLEARGLIGYAAGRSKEWLIAHESDVLSHDAIAPSRELLQRRARGEPYAYLIGRQEFFGREFVVSPAVLIPRPDTELLIEQVLALYPHNEPLNVIDLGTGSGCIAITLALERSSWQVLATDISAEAISIAKNNALLLGANNVQFIDSSWWQNIPEQGFDIIVSNPPYIEKNDIHLSQGDLRFEPRIALTDDADGLIAYREILSGVAKHTTTDGTIFLEHGYDQAHAIEELATSNHLIVVAQKKDLAHQPRLMIARVAP